MLLQYHQHHPIVSVIDTQGSHAPDMTTSPGSTAGVPATPNKGQTPGGPGSPDESSQSSCSDHHSPEPASDKVTGPYCHNAACPEVHTQCSCCVERWLHCICIDDFPYLVADVSVRRGMYISDLVQCTCIWTTP